MSVQRFNLPQGEQFKRQLEGRHLNGRIWRNFFLLAIVVASIALVVLILNTVNQVAGYVAVQNEIEPETLTDGRSLEELSAEELATILTNNLSSGRVRVYLRDNLMVGRGIPVDQRATLPIKDVLDGTYPKSAANKTLSQLEPTEIETILIDNLGQSGLEELVEQQVVGESFVATWHLFDSLLNRGAIEAEVAEDYPNAELRFYSWINGDFLVTPMSTVPADAGIRTALLGTIWLVLMTMVIAFPLGVGAAIYLEEYAQGDHWFERVIETNIRNLAGVPSIIYGLLGLAIFVRALEGITQGRTILSAAATMALLILPVIIINSQEALRAVPSSIREGSFGMGATKWQTIWRAVLPAAMPGILTGTILALSRAIGETAPLIIIGASTYIVTDPQGIFSGFTALPIQIYNWTAQPQEQFRDIAASGIVILLTLLLTLNATAIYLRQRFRRKLSS